MKAASYFFIIIFCLSIQKGYAQKNYIKGFVIGLPFQSGAGIANAGFEHFTKAEKTSWQFSINFAGGELGVDAGSTIREWITIDRSYYISTKNNGTFFYSWFVETGSRKRQPGYIKSYSDSILNQRRAFEINPGIGAGRNFPLGKKWLLQVFAAPKAIIALHNDKYYNISSKTYFYMKYNDLSAGYRFLINFCYQL